MLLAKRLTHKSLDAVACVRMAAVFLGHRETQARVPFAVGSIQEREILVAAARGVLEYAVEGGGVLEP